MSIVNIEDLSDKENLVTSELVYYIRTNDKIELYTSSRLTPDQRRKFLFNAKQPFEVQEQDFDKEWWPLVTNMWARYSSRNHNNGNSWVAYACRFTKHNQSSTHSEGVPNKNIGKRNFDHTHTIEESEMLKHFQLVRNLVKKEAIKNYLSPAIVNAVKEYATKRLDLGASVKKLKRMEVYNIKKKGYGSQNSYLIGNESLELDIEESILFLKKEEYQVECYGQSAQGFIFAHPYQLEKLGRFGWLMLIDSTHKTNKYDWGLFTLIIPAVAVKAVLGIEARNKAYSVFLSSSRIHTDNFSANSNNVVLELNINLLIFAL
ncbi:hypothetical protein C2G38_2175697 [Gigaspora rosea]|uniref:MULE transposase domain-containing protein n=1 Tax=Gigaspora rosea TaxID=44941 RepID=A0A397VIX1_9GLOM|nr:hypothetical protein C2G38_2175697 [Gigaspora rosea]